MVQENSMEIDPGTGIEIAAAEQGAIFENLAKVALKAMPSKPESKNSNEDDGL